MHVTKGREENTMGLGTLCDVESLLQTGMRNNLDDWKRQAEVGWKADGV